MSRYRVCKAFTVESGHMLSKHLGRCRHPHGHTRRIEVVLSSSMLDNNDMVVDFKALRLAVEGFIAPLDHAMLLNSNDPLLPNLLELHHEAVIVFEGEDPTTEVIARYLFDKIHKVLQEGWEGSTKDAQPYSIRANCAQLERVRVYETPTSWAEFGI